MARVLPAKLHRLHQQARSVIGSILVAQLGQAFVEYAILLALLVLAMITVLINFGQSVSQFLLDAACYIGLDGGC